MKYLPVSETQAVCIEAIDMVEANGNTSRIYTDIGVFDCIYPYSTLIGILENNKEENDNTQLLSDISKKVGNLPVFAG